MIAMFYTVYKIQKIQYKTEAVSKAIKQAEAQKFNETQNSEYYKVEIKSKKE